MAKNELTKGALDLPKRRKAKGHLQKDCAAAVGVKQATVSRWEDGTCSPLSAQRAMMEAIYGIPSFWWEPEDVRRRIEAASERLPPEEMRRRTSSTPRGSRKPKR